MGRNRGNRRLQLDAETPEERRARLDANAAAARRRRAQENPEQRRVRLDANADAMRVIRRQENHDQRIARLDANNEATQAARARETPLTADRRRAALRDAVRVHRRTVRAEQSAGLRSYVEFGNLNVECTTCCAISFMSGKTLEVQSPIQYSIIVVKVPDHCREHTVASRHSAASPGIVNWGHALRYRLAEEHC